MSTVNATLRATESAFHVEGQERIDFSLLYARGVFSTDNPELADTYRSYGRCLMVIDEVVHDLHGDRIEAYFAHHDIELTVFRVRIGEKAKTLRTVEQIVDAFADFGLLRKEPVLVVGGGLTTDVAGFACASYKRSTNYIRIPTTLIGLIDASVSIKVAVNHGKHKNRLGAYHASQKVLLDFSLLATLPEDQVRNGMAELVKIAVVANAGIFDLMEKYGEDLLRTRFGHLDGDDAAARGGRHDHLRRDQDDAHPRGAEPARARPRPGDRLRPHLEPDAGADARTGRSSTVTRSRSTWPSRRRSPSSAATSRRCERDRILGPDERPRPGHRQPAPDAGAAQVGDVVDPADPGRPAARGAAGADRQLRVRQRPRHRRAGRHAWRSTGSCAVRYPRRGDGEDMFTATDAS